MSEHQLTIASFNVHAGIDGWGRHFDLVGASRRIDADVLVLQESWSPEAGTPLAREIADACGYEVVEAELARGRMVSPDPALVTDDDPPTWGPGRAAQTRMLRIDGRPGSRRSRLSAAELRLPATRGGWGIALLSRLPVRRHEVVELPDLRGDAADRKAVVAELDVGGTPLVVAGVHLSHLRRGSPIQVRALRHALPPAPTPAVLLGDMNCWGPPLVAMLPGWHRAVTGRTWPAWRPHSQIDHILVRGSVEVLGGEVLPPLGSDHRPVRATLAV